MSNDSMNLHPDDEKIYPLEDATPTATPKHLRSVLGEEIRIGIDFGTSTTAISFKQGDGSPVAIPIGKDGVTRYMPSVVYINPGQGELRLRALVGEDADNQGDELRKIRSIKRCFDCQNRKCGSAKEGETQQFPWCAGKGDIRIDSDLIVLPEEIAFLIICEALERGIKYVRENWGIDLTLENVNFVPLNLGCSARATQAQREILVNISQNLGFNKVTIDNVVEEPVLAGFAFSRFSDDPEGYSLIYDFGGGTLDIAIIDVNRLGGKLQITILSTSGDNWLGGDDIDALVYGEFIRQFAVLFNETIQTIQSEFSALDHAKLRSMAKRAKELLSVSETFEDAFISERLGILDVQLSREEFENLLNKSGLVDKSLNVAHEALKLAWALNTASDHELFDISVFRTPLEIATKLVKRVVLVGGVTKIPCIRKRIEETFSASKIIEEKIIEPITSVAVGAAYPKDAEHFSISVPPFGFVAKYRESEHGGEDQTIVLGDPFEYYEFYGNISNIALPIHTLDFKVKETWHSTRIYLQQAASKKLTEIDNIGRLESGDYGLEIGLDGMVYVQRNGDKHKELFRVSQTHPLQDRIIEEREKRFANNMKKIDERRDDSINSMTFEN